MTQKRREQEMKAWRESMTRNPYTLALDNPARAAVFQTAITTMTQEATIEVLARTMLICPECGWLGEPTPEPQGWHCPNCDNVSPQDEWDTAPEDEEGEEEDEVS